MQSIHRATLVAIVAAIGTTGLAACDDAIAPDQPQCLKPAPLLGSYDSRAPGYIVQYRDGVDPVAETSALAAKYQFTPTSVYTVALHGFAALLSAEAVAGVRCERTVLEVEHDAVGSVASR
jgi:hypothetical protein